jgi:hypothetical protein
LGRFTDNSQIVSALLVHPGFSSSPKQQQLVM